MHPNPGIIIAVIELKVKKIILYRPYRAVVLVEFDNLFMKTLILSNVLRIIYVNEPLAGKICIGFPWP